MPRMPADRYRRGECDPAVGDRELVVVGVGVAFAKNRVAAIAAAPGIALDPGGDGEHLCGLEVRGVGDADVMGATVEIEDARAVAARRPTGAAADRAVLWRTGVESAAVVPLVSASFQWPMKP